MKDPIYRINLEDLEVEISASGTAENDSTPIVFGPRFANETEGEKGALAGRHGELSLAIKLSGSGTLKAQAKVSGNGVDYDIVDTEIVTGLTAGYHVVAFSVPLCTHMTILLTETGGANSITVDECNVISR